MRTGRAKWALLVLALLALVAYFGIGWVRNLRMSHRHCMKIAGMELRIYADDHGGAFPYHTNGYGDALLLLAKDKPENVAFICGPGDDGHVFTNALARGLHVAEAQCSRVYVQGLRATNYPGICILFDRKSVKGGDHFYGSGKPVREACLLDGSMQVISDARWPKFSREQVELLVEAGFSREKALEYYPEAAGRK
jgi:hypothetical protein